MKIGCMINDSTLLDNAKALMDSTKHQVFFYAINDVYFELQGKLANLRRVEVEQFIRFPFYDKVCAAAKAEEDGIDIWLDIDTLFLEEVSFDELTYVSYVDGKNIGVNILDSFWQQLYDYYQLSPQQPIQTKITKELILSYFNMGFVVHFSHFQELKKDMTYFLRNEAFKPYFTDPMYQIFFHQALFSCLLLKYNTFDLLPKTINHPLHMSGELDGVKSIRYDTYFNDGNQLLPYSTQYDLTIPWTYSFELDI